MTRLRALLAVALVLPLAGCLDGPLRTYEVTVTDGPGGPAVAGALLTVDPTWGRERTLRADEAGRATLTARRPYVVVEADGYLPETYQLGRETRPDLPIFRATMALALDGSLAGGDVGTQGTPLPDRWDAQEVPFGATREAQRAYASRLQALHVTLTWNNTLLGGAGDLGIGLGPAADELVLWHDGDQAQLAQGPQREEARFTLRDFGREWQDAEGLWAGAAAGKAYASATGLAYTLALVATFGPPHGAPALAMAGVLSLIHI